MFQGYDIIVKIGFCGCGIYDNNIIFIGAFSDFGIQAPNSDLNLNLKFKFKSGFWTWIPEIARIGLVFLGIAKYKYYITDPYGDSSNRFKDA